MPKALLRIYQDVLRARERRINSVGAEIKLHKVGNMLNSHYEVRHKWAGDTRTITIFQAKLNADMEMHKIFNNNKKM